MKSLTFLLGNSLHKRRALQELQNIDNSNVDVRLLTDLLQKSHAVMRSLGLDPADTTLDELYGALLNTVRSGQWTSLLKDTDYVLVNIENQIISLNPIDIINNFHHHLPVEKRRSQAGILMLEWEITRRYTDKKPQKKQQIQQIAKKAGLPTEKPLFCSQVFDKPTIIAIGDIATEALINIDDQKIEPLGDKNHPLVALPLGAKLICQQSEIQDAVGGSVNAAIVFTKMGLQASLMSWLGDDTTGESTRQYLRGLGIDMSGVKTQKYMRSNYHYVLRYGPERTILANYEKFNYKWQTPTCRPDWIYLSSISDQSWPLHENLLQYLEDNPQVKFAFQPSPAHFAWGKDKLADLYARSTVVIMNLNEAMTVSCSQVRSVKAIMKSLHNLGIKMAVITDGARGAFASDGQRILKIKSYPDPKPPTDRTGAGDAFAATIVASLAQGDSLKKAMQKAPINSMSVVQHVGAQKGILSPRQIQKYLKEADSDYKVIISDLD